MPQTRVMCYTSSMEMGEQAIDELFMERVKRKRISDVHDSQAADS